MEVKKEDTTVIVRPIACRPSRSSFMSLSDLIAHAINVSPSSAFSDATTMAIRPKTMRLKPVVDSAAVGVISSQDQISGSSVCNSLDDILRLDRKSPTLHKPLAKLVPETTASLFTNLGNLNTRNQEALAQVQTHGLQSDEAKQFHPTRLASSHFLKSRSQMEMNYTIKSSKSKLQNLAKNQRSLPPTNSGDRISYDGYNWRKYGQKQVNGSECPRSYYKCTHPNCPVKKKVEKSVDGKIKEIVYEDEHIHPRIQLLKHLPSEAKEGYKFSETCEETGIPPTNILLNEGSEGGVKDQNEVGLLIDPTCPGKALIHHERGTTRMFNKGVRIPDNPSGPGGDHDEGSRRADAEDDEPEYKRSKNDGQLKKLSTRARRDLREPCVMVQNSRDSEILRDGFRWRKYGQKVVKGNPYPRSYYRCTNLECDMRKHVERALDDPTAFITTYEGKHNHDLPGTGTKSLNPVASNSDSLLAPSKQNQTAK